MEARPHAPGRDRTGARVAACAVLALVAAACTALVAGPASATDQRVAQRSTQTNSIGLRLVDVPPAAAKDPRANLYIVDQLAPGRTIERRIEVSNTTASTARVRLYSGAATLRNGTFIGSDGRTPNELSTWTTVRPSTIDVPAGGRSIARVRIAVPRDAAAGEQYGAVWAEVRAAPTTNDGRTTGTGITQVNRVGIRLYVSVGPGGGPASSFTIESMVGRRTPEGRPVVMAEVRNTGGRALDLVGTVDLADGPGGVRAGPFSTAAAVTVAIGATEQVPITLPDELPTGPWTAHLVVRSGLLERTATGPMTFPDRAIAPAAPWWRTWGIALLLLLLALGLTTFVLRRRRASVGAVGGASGSDAPMT